MRSDRLRQTRLSMLMALDALLAEENVTRAAARLGVTQSAMSHSLRQLREHFDDPLLVRGPRGLTPTRRALEIGAPLRRGLAELDRAVEGSTSFDPGDAERSFTLATGDFFAVQFVPELSALVSKEAPGVDLVVRPSDPRRDIERLESGDVDVVVSVQRPDVSFLRARRLFVETFACVVRKGHPDVKGALDLKTFVRLPHLLISPAGGGTSYIDTALARHGLTRRVALRLPYFLAAPLVVARTDLLLTAPRRVAETFARTLPLALFAPPIEVASFSVHALWHERNDRDPAQVWLRAALVRAVERSHIPLPSTPPRDRGRTPRARAARAR